MGFSVQTLKIQAHYQEATKSPAGSGPAQRRLWEGLCELWEVLQELWERRLFIEEPINSPADVVLGILMGTLSYTNQMS